MFIVTVMPVIMAPVGTSVIESEVMEPAVLRSLTIKDIAPEVTPVAPVAAGVAEPVSATLSPRHIVLLDGVIVSADGDIYTPCK
jgi:hypothetical protein